MVEAAGAVSARLSRGLPNEIVIWEILVRLPPKTLLRCRAFCRDDIMTFGHNAQLQHVARLDKMLHRLDASCDGLLLLLRSYDFMTGPYFSICNPATRQSTRLPMISHFTVLGMYAHQPTGENRVLLVLVNEWLFLINMDGKLVATFHFKEVVPTQFQIKQTLVPHTFFSKLEGYAVNDSPFT